MNRAAVHTGLFYAAMFSAFAGVLPFWPVWMEDWGLSPAEVGATTGFGIISRTIGGLVVPVVADRLDSRRAVAMFCGLVCAAVFLAHYWFETKFLILVGMIIFSACIAGLMPIGEALGSVAARHEGFSYARVRSMGSLGFLAAATILGFMVGWWGSDVALFWIVVWLVVTSFLARKHPGGGRVSAAPPGLRDIWRMMTHRVFLIFTLVVAFA